MHLRITYLFICRKGTLIQSVRLLGEFERRDYESHPTFSQLFHNILASPDVRPEVRADRKVHIEHHDKFGTSMKSRNVPPKVELSLEWVKNKVNIDISGHVRGCNI